MSDLDRNSDASDGTADPAPVSSPSPDVAGVRADAMPPIRVPGRPSRLIVIAIAVMALVAAAAGWLDARRTQRELRTEVAERLAGIETTTQSVAKIEAQLATELNDAKSKVDQLEAQLAESQSQQAALEALYRDLAPSRDEIALSEVEQILLVASQQLQLAGNVPSALTALQLAEGKLKQLDRPQFLPLRRSLTRDIEELKALPYIDIAGLSIKLDQAIALVPSLPLAMDERVPYVTVAKPEPEPDVPAWRRVLREAWTQMRDLVRIETTDRPAAPLLAPAQQYFLRENLRLQLFGARLALQNHNDAGFRSDLSAANAWLAQYFDTRAKPVQSVQATLKQVAATPAASAMPDLARSLEALRVLRLAQDRAPGRAPAVPPAAAR